MFVVCMGAAMLTRAKDSHLFTTFLFRDASLHATHLRCLLQEPFVQC